MLFFFFRNMIFSYLSLSYISLQELAGLGGSVGGTNQTVEEKKLFTGHESDEDRTPESLKKF